MESDGKALGKSKKQQWSCTVTIDPRDSVNKQDMISKVAALYESFLRRSSSRLNNWHQGMGHCLTDNLVAVFAGKRTSFVCPASDPIKIWIVYLFWYTALHNVINAMHAKLRVVFITQTTKGVLHKDRRHMITTTMSRVWQPIEARGIIGRKSCNAGKSSKKWKLNLGQNSIQGCKGAYLTALDQPVSRYCCAHHLRREPSRQLQKKEWKQTRHTRYDPRYRLRH